MNQDLQGPLASQAPPRVPQARGPKGPLPPGAPQDQLDQQGSLGRQAEMGSLYVHELL